MSKHVVAKVIKRKRLILCLVEFLDDLITLLFSLLLLIDEKLLELFNV